MSNPISDMPEEMAAKVVAAQAAGHPSGPRDDPAELARRAAMYRRRTLSWEDIAAMLRDYVVFYEVGGNLSPWPDDPDCGELRLVTALREIVEVAIQRGPDAALSTEFLRALLARHLARHTFT